MILHLIDTNVSVVAAWRVEFEGYSEVQIGCGDASLKWAVRIGTGRHGKSNRRRTFSSLNESNCGDRQSHLSCVKYFSK